MSAVFLLSGWQFSRFHKHVIILASYLYAGYNGAHLLCTSYITLFIPGCMGRLCYIPII